MIGSTVAQYEILEQLGSGGMGVVYKARDTRLGRTVALKFLPAQISQDAKAKARFMQEARAASSLDDPHICTIYEIAETDDGQLFIVMAFYDGNTLKYVLEERKIGVEEACSIARQIAQGLATAHDAGIVHRDIKPANIMVTERGLVKILDFGVAKLGELSDLTREGSTIGTAAYMSPEQARGESVDKRSDVWSVGAVLYEMLSGSRPFGGGYDAAVAYSILNEEPAALDSVSEGLPHGLADVVWKCLAKVPDHRYASGRGLADTLSAFTEGSAVQTSTMSAVSAVPVTSVQKTVIRFVLIAAVVLAAIYGAMIGLGLPGWIFPAGVLLMLVGLPIVLYSSALERRRKSLDSGERAELSGLGAWLTTQRAYRGGVIAIGALVLLSGGFIGLRAAGVGPFATLISGGTLSAQDLLIVADFQNPTSDASLGSTVTEALKIDLSQSTAIRIMDRSAVQSALQRMQVNADTALSASLALAVAEREGVKAIIEGDINSAGASFILNARILSAVDGSQLAAYRETARDDRGIVDAIDRLSAKLREEIGESLVDIRGNDPLERVTTASVQALKLHTEAEQLSNVGKDAEAIELLQAAIAEDSLFAMAYRKLAVLFGNTGAARQLQEDAAEKAFELRDRLPWRERMLAEAYYYGTVENDRDEVIRTYQELLKRYPYDEASLNNLALEYLNKGRFADAEPLLRKALEVSEGTVFRGNLIASVAMQGRLDDALMEIDAYEAAIPNFIQPAAQRANVLYAQREYELADAWIDTMEVRSAQPFQLAGYHNQKDNYLLARGRINEANAFRRKLDAYDLDNTIRGEGDAPRDLDSLFSAFDRANEIAWITGDTREFKRVYDELTAMLERIGGVPENEHPYNFVAGVLFQYGMTDEARNWLELDDAYHRRTGDEVNPNERNLRAYVDAMSGGDVEAAVRAIEEGLEEMGCDRCWRWELGQIHELNRETDAAIDAYEAYVDTPSLSALGADEGTFALAEFRLGALFEERGELDQAITYYTRMTERWKDADAVLQPQVAEARRRIEALLDRKAREGG